MTPFHYEVCEMSGAHIDGYSLYYDIDMFLRLLMRLNIGDSKLLYDIGFGHKLAYVRRNRE
jgi:hypothetical protein